MGGISKGSSVKGKDREDVQPISTRRLIKKRRRVRRQFSRKQTGMVGDRQRRKRLSTKGRRQKKLKGRDGCSHIAKKRPRSISVVSTFSSPSPLRRVKLRSRQRSSGGDSGGALPSSSPSHARPAKKSAVASGVRNSLAPLCWRPRV